MRIISRAKRRDTVTLRRVYDRRGEPGCGFSFECNRRGEVDTAALAPAGLANYLACESGELDVVYQGIQKDIHTWREPAVGECECGTEVELANFTNTCHGCGADYNSAGQRLAPRECWGEETGEHWTDCY